MNSRHLLICLPLLFACVTQGQTVFYLNGATAKINNTTLYLDGSMIIENSGTIDNSGTIELTGDWENNSGTTGLINSSPGEVNMNGANQEIKGADATKFYDLNLGGTGVKSMSVDAEVEGTLDLTDRELSTDVNEMHVSNASINAIQRSTGFVSSEGDGKLARSTDALAAYLFPTGSSSGTQRYRPLEVTPSTTNAQTFGARMANVDPTSEGYDRALAQDSICVVNPNYFHRVSQIAGADPADVAFYYDTTADGKYSKLAHWETVPEWQSVGTVVVEGNADPVLNRKVTKMGWSDFNPDPFVFANEIISPDIAFTGSLVFCPSDSVVLSVPSTYGTFNWSNGATTSTITVVSSGTYDVTVADASNGCSAVSPPVVVVVEDTVPPTIACPADFSVLTDAGNCDAMVSYADPTATDNCGLASFTQTMGAGSGETYDVGFETQQYVAMDFAGNATTCSFVIEVVDDPDDGPTAVCRDITVNLNNRGRATISAISVNNGSFDNCGIFFLSATPTTFKCEDVGVVPVSLTVRDNNLTLSSCIANVTINSTLGATVAVTDVSCAGGDGALDATATGGARPYVVSWSDGTNTVNQTSINNLDAGTYVLSIVDSAGCTFADTFELDDQAPIIGSASITNASGPPNPPDGAIDLTITGTATPITFAWSNGATTEDISGLTPGMYTVTATDASSCQQVETYEVEGAGPVCPVVDGLNVTRLTSTSARLNWASVVGAQSYELRGMICGAGAPPIVLSGISGSATFQNVADLSPSTCYWWEIRAFCDPNGVAPPSPWSAIDTFTTNCAAPENLNATNITATSARLNWTRVPGVVGYQLRGRRAGGTNVPPIDINSGSQQSLNTGNILTSNTEYVWEMRAKCDQSGTRWSDWTALDTFKTVCLPPDNHFADNITTNSARLRWTSVSGIGGYHLQGKRADQTGWFDFPLGPNVTQVPANNLGTNVTYTWRIRSQCDANATSFSTWTSIDSFTTLPARLGRDDVDGEFSLGGTDAEFEMSLFPNPNEGQFKLQVEGLKSDKDVEVYIYDIFGIEVLNRKMKPEGFVNKSLNLDLALVAKGTYLVKVVNGDLTSSARVVVQ